MSKKYICYEDGIMGLYTMGQLVDLYEEKIDNMEYPKFDCWVYDMIKMDIIKPISKEEFYRHGRVFLHEDGFFIYEDELKAEWEEMDTDYTLYEYIRVCTILENGVLAEVVY